MASSPERKTSIYFDGFSKSPTAKSPRNFDDGAVGLGIVAAMSDPVETQAAKIPRPAIPPRAVPIPIISVKTGTGNGGGVRGGEVEKEMELSESYTCVISHVGGKSVRKRVYFDDGVSDGIVRNYWGDLGADSEWPLPVEPALPAADFLNRCYLCRKKLHGLDIFMYRGDKAFCSPECRFKQIAIDEHIEKFGSGALKPFDCSASPCSAPLNFAVGIAAA